MMDGDIGGYGYICPYCGEALEYGEAYCPSCGNPIDQSFYDTYYDGTDPGDGEDARETTRITAVDPQMDRGTRIMKNPLREVRYHKLRHRDDQSDAQEQKETDEFTEFVEWSRYVYVRLNTPERWSVWLLLAAIMACFSPWYHSDTFQSLISGYEQEGLWAGILAAASLGVLVSKIHFRWGWWASLLALVLSGGSTAVVFYVYMRGDLPKLSLVAGVHMSLLTLGLATFFLLIGAIKRAI